MCEHCGCRGVPPVAELMDEHRALLDEAHGVRQALAAGDRGTALARLDRMVAHLARHVRREEDGILAALRADGEYADEVTQLEREHRGFDAAVSGLDMHAPDLEARVARLLGDLEEHVEREDLGIFPVSVVTLAAGGWDLVERAHAATPTFLGPPAGAAPA